MVSSLAKASFDNASWFATLLETRASEEFVENQSLFIISLREADRVLEGSDPFKPESGRHLIVWSSALCDPLRFFGMFDVSQDFILEHAPASASPF